MPRVVLAKTRRTFPGRPVRYRAARGMGDSFGNELINEAILLPSAPSSLWQNLTTGTLSPAQLQYIQMEGEDANQVAAATPTTGQVNQPLLDQANAQLMAETAAASNVTAQSTGSVLADLVDTAQGTGPGLLASLGINSSAAGGLSINWSSVLQSVLIFGGLGLAAYFIVKKL